jgi:flagellar motor switch protein FliM
MSQDFLSQEEIDALLVGVPGDVGEVKPAADSTGVRFYDLVNQERMVRGRMPTLEIINEQFTRQLRLALFNFMRHAADVSVGPIRTIQYTEFVRNLVMPTHLNLVHAKPLHGTALFVFDPTLTFLIVDNLFGGDGRFHSPVQGRALTQTEQRIIQRLLGVIFEEYEKSWKPVYELKFEFVQSETNTQFVNVAAPNEVVVVTTFSIQFGPASGEFHICLPYAMIEPVRDLLYRPMQGAHPEADKRWLQQLVQQVQTAEVELVATLGRTDVTFNEILNMKAGDVIACEMSKAIAAAVDGVPVMECHYGVFNGKYALKVDKMLSSPAID